MGRQKRNIDFDAKRAAIKLVRLEDTHQNIQRMIDEQLNRRRSIRTALIDALSELPVALAQKGHIADGAEYILEAFDRSKHFDTPMYRNGGAGRAEKELAKLADIAARLCNLLGEMHRDTLSAIGGPDKSPVETATMLRRLALNVMHHAIDGMESLSLSPSKKDPPAEKRQARHVTQAALEVYQGLTQRPAKRRTENPATKGAQKSYGPAKEYLQKIYKALEIDARADGQMRVVREAQRRMESLQPDCGIPIKRKR